MQEAFEMSLQCAGCDGEFAMMGQRRATSDPRRFRVSCPHCGGHVAGVSAGEIAEETVRYRTHARA